MVGCLCSSIEIPQKIWNNDAYIYLFTKENKFKHVHQDEAILYYRAPNTVQEHLKQSTKFQFSLQENLPYFSKPIGQHFAVPKQSLVYGLLSLALKNIFSFAGYIALLIVSRISKPLELPKHSYWQTDISTKNI
jgi:hypothetical protein